MRNNEEGKIGSPEAPQNAESNSEISVAQPSDNVNPSGIPHGFDTGYAIAYGVEEAIMIRNFQHFITANANRRHNFRDGRFWTYDKLEDFPYHFPYWTFKQVRRILKSLIDQGVIIKGDFNNSWSNRTGWYAFKDQNKFIRNIVVPKTPLPVDPDLPIWANEICPNGNLTFAQMGKSNIGTTSIASSVSSTSLKVSAEGETPSGVMPAKAGEDKVDESPQKKSKKAKIAFTNEVIDVAADMIEILKKHEPDYSPPPNLAPFRTEVDFMLRIDKRDPQKICDVLNWALSDSFWRSHIFKPNPAKYLREKFLQLKNKMDAKPPERKIDRKGFAPCSNDEKAIETMREMGRRAL